MAPQQNPLRTADATTLVAQKRRGKIGNIVSKTKAILAGLLTGFVAAVLMTTSMLLLATLGVATPLVIIGDRLSVFIPPGPFLSLMGKVGGYNHLKQLGVGSTIAGQLLVGAIGGAIFALFVRRTPGRIATIWTILIFVLLPVVVYLLRGVLNAANGIVPSVERIAAAAAAGSKDLDAVPLLLTTQDQVIETVETAANYGGSLDLILDDAK